MNRQTITTAETRAFAVSARAFVAMASSGSDCASDSSAYQRETSGHVSKLRVVAAGVAGA